MVEAVREQMAQALEDVATCYPGYRLWWPLLGLARIVRGGKS